ncbi:tail fiber domain-containing protein [Rossellomorea marisflavi]|uniref:Tail fiber domain-containing protein n=1 Tax=Rossellomorea marisflavi TaxID=189381 RepID=A0A5D4RYI4_9BACI|nr:tail fiber domain-containing protein [Rossellomorea marisflavi]TYS56455.1 tail fiber domain-containing protein [Rossellomorea marisflavi]
MTNINSLGVSCDERDVSDVRKTQLGLEFLKSLNPVDFRSDSRSLYTDVTDNGLRVLPKDGSRKGDNFHHGFIPQDLQKLISPHPFGGLVSGYNNGFDTLSVNYNEFISPIVRSIQELAEENAALKREIELLKNK